MVVCLVDRFSSRSLVRLELWVELSNWERKVGGVLSVDGKSHDSGLLDVVTNHMQKRVIKKV